MRCRTCGQENPTWARFCPNCGASQLVGNEGRRVVTALFADVVGFTSLAETLDPEEAKHLIDRCFERLIRNITSFGGVIDKVLGDGLVALFGAPIAHEDDAERAVRAALAMQESMIEMADSGSTPLELRVGVNTGEVLVGGSKAGGDYTAMGDVMNTASRLESEAKPGEILVGSSTYEATKEAIAYDSVGRLEVKGREGLVRAYVARQSKRPPGARTPRSTPFVGRGAELDLMGAQIRLGIDTNRAQLAVVAGETGMGKTRLVEEVASQAVHRWGATVLNGRCVPYGEANVWWPIADIIRRVWDFDVDLSNAEANELLGRFMALAGEVDDKLDAERLKVALLHILGFETPLRGGDRLRNRREVVYAVTTVLTKLLDESPVILVLSDFHWATEAVQTVVTSAIEALAHRQLTVLLTARSGKDLGFSEIGCSYSRIQLEALRPETARAMLIELGLDLPSDAVMEFFDRSGGNPFFIEELASLVSKTAVVDGPTVDRQSISEILDTVPGTLRGLVAARLDQLAPEQRVLLDDAAVLGRSGSVESLLVMSRIGRGIDDIEDTLDSLVRSEFLEVVGSRFSFKSDLVRDVAYGTITKADRAKIHAKVAEFLEKRFHPGDRSSTAIAIATHYRSAATMAEELATMDELGLSRLKEKAIQWLSMAGEISLLAGEPVDAERFFDDALALQPEADQVEELLYGRARANCERHELDRSISDLDELGTMVPPDSVLAAKAMMVRGDIERKRSHHKRSSAYLAMASDRLGELGLFVDESYALRMLGLNEIAAGNNDDADRALQRSREVARLAGDRRSEAWTLQSMAFHAYTRRRMSEAATLIEAATESFSVINDRAGLSWTRALEAWVAFHQGDWKRARKLVDQVLPETSRRGDPWAEGVMLALAASLDLWSGNARLASELARESSRAAKRAEDGALAVQSQAIEARALVSLGRVSEGTAQLERVTAAAIRLGDQSAVRFMVTANCTSAARLGDHARSIKWARRYSVSSKGVGVVGDNDLTISLALALLHAGQVAEADETLRQAKSDWGSPWYALAVETLLLAASGRSDELVRIVEQLEDSGTYLDRVYSIWALALDRRRHGEPWEPLLDEARNLISATDDRVTAAIHGMIRARCHDTDPAEAQSVLRSFGVDPEGWMNLVELILDC